MNTCPPQGDIILVGLREYQDEKADVILKYLADEARNLKQYGELPEHSAFYEQFLHRSTLLFPVRVNETDFGDEAADENRDVFDFVDVEGMLHHHVLLLVYTLSSQTSDLVTSLLCVNHMIACHPFWLLLQHVLLLCSRVSAVTAPAPTGDCQHSSLVSNVHAVDSRHESWLSGDHVERVE